MAKYELQKSVEARKLSKRTGMPTNDQPITIPFGAIIEDVIRTEEYVRFTYLVEQFQLRPEIVHGAIHPIGGGELPPIEASAGSREAAETPAVAAPAGAVSQAPAKLLFERLSCNLTLYRTSIPGGWLVAGGSGSVAFVPDLDHAWDGSTSA